jgi:hypothetical protein
LSTRTEACVDIRWHQAKGRRRQHVGKAQHALAPDLVKGKAEQLEEKLEVAMSETLGVGGDGAEGTGRQSARSHRPAGASLQDLLNAPHLDG